MARRKRTSPALVVARQRLAGLKKITKPNLGPNTTVEAFEAVINDTAVIEDSHNQLAAQMDDSSNKLDAQEALMADWNRRVLAAVEAEFGPHSSEYEMVGGTSTSDRKRPSKKKAGSGSEISSWSIGAPFALNLPPSSVTHR
jgi:hypothetical protein